MKARPTTPRGNAQMDALVAEIIDTIAQRVSDRLSDQIAIAHDATAKEMQPEFLGEEAIEKLTGISRRTLQGWRARGRGPDFVRAGRRVLYARSAVESFLKSNTQ